AEAPTYRRYFGDTHFHTGTGSGNRWNDTNGDHSGGYNYGEQAWTYARDVSRLDFGSLSEHDSSMTATGWTAAQQLADEMNTSGFTAFVAYEWTKNDNHQIVIFNADTAAYIPRSSGNFAHLVSALEDQGAGFVIIPHPMSQIPTGRLMYQPGEIDERYSRLAEFHSDHAIAPQDFELGSKEDLGTAGVIQVDGTELINSLQYAWGNSDGAKHHLHVGVIGSSDNHTQTPGLFAHTVEANQGSLAAALAYGNDRDGIWDSLIMRRTYGTTGARIYLDFSVDGLDLGGGYVSTSPRSFHLKAAGTEPLARVEIVRFEPDGIDGGTYREIHVATSGFANGGYTYERDDLIDADNLATLAPLGEVFYYLRVYEHPQAAAGCQGAPAETCVPYGYAMSTPIWVSVNDCNTNGISDLLEVSNGWLADCDNNLHPDECELAAGSAFDLDSNGVLDRCEDCNTNGIPDRCDLTCAGPCNISSCGLSVDCQTNGIPDECEPDCNHNGSPDDCDIGIGTSLDCGTNGIPDECDIETDPTLDCDLDGKIDGCPPMRGDDDCNANSVRDACDIAAGTSADCNGNVIPDECETPDCNVNLIPDECELAAGSAADCNVNDVPDTCDIAAGTSPDVDMDDVPDECQDCNTNDITDLCDVTCAGGCDDVESCGLSDDCDANDVPDECQPDCNTNATADACECFPNDFDRDGDADLRDYAYFQLCQSAGGPVSFDCSSFAGCDTNGALDFRAFFDATTNGDTGPHSFEIVGGAHVPCYAPGSGTGGGYFAKILAPAEPQWTYVEGNIALQVQRLDGSGPRTTLRADTIYALHVTGDIANANFYLATVVAGSASESIALAAAPTDGDWANTGNFVCAPTADAQGEGLPADDYGADLQRTHFVIDNTLGDPARTVAVSSRLFNFRTAGPGEFTMTVYLEATDVAAQTTLWGEADLALTVGD
ncbi:MAG TPA: DUF3604 domain-containing protein, partial [Phycisphaerae bacterium]|nr:DUF3604 domain-containing protein [Phycisphaerae bacterium]